MSKTFDRPIILGAVLALAACEGPPEIDQSASALIFSPIAGGPAALSFTNTPCRNLSTAYCFNAANPPITTAAAARVYLDNVARNWGCTWLQGTHAVYPAGGGPHNFSKYYGRSEADLYGCGVAYWNYEKQAALFIPTSATMINGVSNGAAPEIYDKYAVLGWEQGALGLPLSNPIPYGWTGTTYQFFQRGLITYSPFFGAHHVGGWAAEDRALADTFSRVHNTSPTSAGSPAVYPLTQDPQCTSLLVGSYSCTILKSGVATRIWDYWWNQPAILTARTGWTTGQIVWGPMAQVWTNDAGPFGAEPWLGSRLGFPLSELKPAGLAQNGEMGYNQQFEGGHITWQPEGCSGGGCTGDFDSPPGGGCDNLYGSRYTNYVALIPQSTSPRTSASDLTMFCGAQVIGPVCTPSQPIPFSVPGGGAGTYHYHCNTPHDLWYSGITLTWNNQTISIRDPIYSKWIESSPTSPKTVQNAIDTVGLPLSEQQCDERDGFDTDCQFLFQTFGDGSKVGVHDTSTQLAWMGQPAFASRVEGEGYDTIRIQLSRSLLDTTYCGLPISVPTPDNKIDRDRDCLHDGMEAELAHLLSPRIYLDEGENLDLNNPHFKPLDLYQVRPLTGNVIIDREAHPDEVVFSPSPVSAWPGIAGQKSVIVRYVMSYPFQDSYFDHVGDTELIEVRLFTTDLITYDLVNVVYTHHNSAHVFGHSYLTRVARELGGVNISVLSDEDSHGSWPGMHASGDNSTRCAASGYLNQTCSNSCMSCDAFRYGALQAYCATPGDDFRCLESTLGNDTENGDFRWFNTTRNVGEPTSGVDRWNTNWPGPTRIEVTDGLAKLFHDTGHFDAETNSTVTYEALTNAPTALDPTYALRSKKACGWKCPERDSAGDCVDVPHDTVVNDRNCDSGCFQFRTNGNDVSFLPRTDIDWCYNLWGTFNRQPAFIADSNSL